VAWIKRNGTNWSHIFSVSSAATYPFFGINNAAKFFFTNTGTNVSTVAGSFTSGNWYQIAMTRSMTNTGTGCATAPCVTYYVNGVQLGDMIADPLVGSNATFDQIAARTVATAQYHNGGIAALGFYSDVLTQAEILQMCNTYASRFPSGQACNP
jgi:hypothetical protein